MKINQTALKKALSNKKRTILMWVRKEGYHYLCDGHFILKTKEQLSSTLLAYLIKELGEQVQEGQGLALRNGHITDAPNGLLEMIDKAEPDVKTRVYDTKLVHNGDKTDCRIYQGEEYIYLDTLFTNIVKDLSSVDTYSNTGLAIDSVVFFGEDSRLLILPVRRENDPKHLKRIIDITC